MSLDLGNPQLVGTFIACFAVWGVVATILLVRVYCKIWRQHWRLQRAARHSDARR
jgi:hypothetical protein